MSTDYKEDKEKAIKLLKKMAGRPVTDQEIEAFWAGYLTGYNEALRNIMPDLDEMIKPFGER